MRKQMFRSPDGDEGGAGAGTPNAYDNWMNRAEKTDDELLVERQEFIATKTTDEWAADAASAGKDVMTLQRDAWNSGNKEANLPPAFVPNQLWTDFKDTEGFVVPENITAENEQELLKKALVDSGAATGGVTQPPTPDPTSKPTLDPEYDAYMTWKKVNPDKGLTDYAQINADDSSYLSLGDKDFMVEYYKKEYGLYDPTENPDGLTEEQINNAVDSLENSGQLPIESRKLKSDIRKSNTGRVDRQREEAETTATAQATAARTAIETDLSTLFVETDKITELNGVKISKADVTSINEAFKKAVLPDSKGNVPIVEMLQSNDNLWNFFAVNFQGDSKFKDALFNATDSTKDELIKKLGLTPRIDSGRQSDIGHNQNVITPSKWAEPDSADV